VKNFFDISNPKNQRNLDNQFCSKDNHSYNRNNCCYNNKLRSKKKRKKNK